MDAQLKKGILETAVLSALAGSDSYGYKIVQDLSKITDITESTLYPILRRLEISKCLKTFNMEYNGRLRKYYSLTQDGVMKIRNFLDEWKEVNSIYEFIREKAVIG